MSYIGNTPTQQNFVAGADQFSGNGSTTAFTLSRNVNTVFDIFVAISNVPQDPYSAYSVSGNTLTFTSAPPSGTGNIYVVYRATNVQTFVPSPGATVGGSFGIQGNLNFYGTGNRITGDFSNGTIANRVMFQSSTTNGQTSIGVLPNGTGGISSVNLFGTTDPANASLGQLATTTNEVRLQSGITGTGTYLPMTFYTGGSERMRIDTSGNVGIGTASPISTAKVSIKQAAGGGTGSTQLHLEQSNATDGYGLKCDSANGDLTFSRYASGSYTERARLDLNGNFIVGSNISTTATGQVTIWGAASTKTQIYMQRLGQVEGHIGFLGSTNSNWYFNTSSTLGNTGVYMVNNGTAWTSNSDERLKTDLVPIENGAAKVASLRAVTGRYKTDTEGTSRAFLIAQDVKQVLPEAISETEIEGDDTVYYGVAYTDVIPLLVAAVKELNAKVEAQAAEIAALKGAA